MSFTCGVPSPLPPLPPLPIDDLLGELVARVREVGRAVLVAPPGAGKTTRVPGALLDAGLAEGGDVVVLQPRRIAARLAAARVAEERGGALGAEVGYEVRFDRQVSAATRIRFVTEGLLTRRLLGDPTLRGTACVLLDEFHERHLDGDVALALLVHAQRTVRPDLRIVVMSATLDAEPVAAFLGAPVVRSEGRAFPVDISFTEPAALVHDGRPRQLGALVGAALRPRLREPGGDALVFLPGAGEIRRLQDDLAELAASCGCDLVPLHGDLTAAEQDRAVRRGSGKRKIILATNVAETSVTIDGVTLVIDSGLARVARHSPWTGVASLQIEPIARASAIQRAGRAGRTAPGACVRLYTRQDFDQRRAFDDPEVQRADLAEVALAVACSGRGRLGALPWFEAPPSAALTAAERLLVRLGAVTEDGAPTPTGRSLAALPVHPRLAAVLRACEDGGAAAEGALMAACLGARELRLERRGRGGQARVASESDVIDDLDAMLDARAGGLRAERLRSAGLDVGTALQVDRAARQLERLCERRGARPRGDAALDEVLQRALLRGFPDRVGRRRAPRGREVVLADGGSATLAETSAVLDAEWMLAIDAAETQRGKAALRRASAIDPGWLLEEFTDQIDDVDELVWNRARTRVERTRALRYGALTIEETSAPVEDLAAAGAILAREALAAGIGAFLDEDELATWRRRVTLVAERTPGLDLRPLDDAQLAAQLAAACAGLTSFAELRGAGLLGLLDASLGPARRTVDERAPTHVRLRGRQVRVNYPADGTPPWIASRMQDFFGLARGPAILGGQLPLVLHLLAPNQRAVQVTQDLPGFWTKHYPGLRNALARRYPRHVWPEDPLTLIEAE